MQSVNRFISQANNGFMRTFQTLMQTHERVEVFVIAVQSTRVCACAQTLRKHFMQKKRINSVNKHFQ